MWAGRRVIDDFPVSSRCVVTSNLYLQTDYLTPRAFAVLRPRGQLCVSSLHFAGHLDSSLSSQFSNVIP